MFVFSLGLLELLFLFSLALIILGPEKLPKMAQKLAHFIHQLRAVKDEVSQQFSDEDNV